MSNPAISIIIPVKNEAENIKPCLEAVFAQELKQAFEVIIIDSGSTDGTVEVAKKFDIQLHFIKPEEFSHGRTRQLGASLAKGEFIVFTVADAEPTNNKWLANLVAPLLKDEKVAASYGVQLVRAGPGNDPIARGIQLTQFNREPLQKLENGQELTDLAPGARRTLCNFDDCTSCIRKEILIDLPFPNVNYAEDFLWCKKAIVAGHTVVFAPKANVYHYHHQTISYVFKRACYDQIISGREFEMAYCDTFCRFLGMCLYTVKESCRILRKEPIGIFSKTSWFFYNLKIEAVRHWGFFIGSLGVSQYGKRHTILRKFTEKTRKRVIKKMEKEAIIHD